ncbi:MAG: L-asparaginase [Acidobacteria bacterium]|nr:L-asparaginase [Acidobacteriota bacterium]
MKHITLIFILAFATLNLSAQPGKRDEKSENDIRRVMNEQAIAWNAGDIEGYMKGYRNSPQLKFVSGSNVTRGWQPTLERYKKNYDSKAKMGVLSFSDLEITILSKDSAVVLGTWTLRREKDNPGGKFTLIFRKFKEGWRIVHDHTS